MSITKSKIKTIRLKLKGKKRFVNALRLPIDSDWKGNATKKNYIPVSRNDLFLCLFFVSFHSLWLVIRFNRTKCSQNQYFVVLIENHRTPNQKKWANDVDLLFFSLDKTDWLNSARSMNFGQFVVVHPKTYQHISTSAQLQHQYWTAQRIHTIRSIASIEIVLFIQALKRILASGSWEKNRHRATWKWILNECEYFVKLLEMFIEATSANWFPFYCTSLWARNKRIDHLTFLIASRAMRFSSKWPEAAARCKLHQMNITFYHQSFQLDERDTNDVRYHLFYLPWLLSPVILIIRTNQ